MVGVRQAVEMPSARRVAPFLVAAALGAGLWAGWLGWDQEYSFDPAVGAEQGPYRPAQVVGCGVSVLLGTAVLALRWPGLTVAAGVTVGFWLPWTAQAAARDESGLFLVGSLMVLAGLSLGTMLAAAAALLVRGWRSEP